MSIRCGLFQIPLCVAALAATSLLPSAAVGQMSAAAALGAMTQQDVASKAAEVRAKLAQVESLAELDKETKTKIRERYESALRTLEEIAKTDEASARFAEDAKSAAANAAELRVALVNLQKKPPIGASEAKPLAELDTDRATREANVATLRQDLAAIEAERSARSGRKAEIQRIRADADTRRAEFRKQADATAPESEAPALVEARRLDAGLKLLAFERSLSLLNFEQAKYETEEAAELLRHREELKRVEVAREEAAVRELTRVVNERRAKDAEDKIERARRQSLFANPLLRSLADENSRDAEANAGLSKTIAEVERATVETNENFAALTARFNDIRDKERQVGLTRPIGLMLREQRASFPDLRQLDKDLEDRENRVDEIQVGIWKCDETISALPTAREHVLAAAETEGRRRDSMSPEQWSELERAAEELLRSRREILGESKQLRQSYLEALNQLDFADRLYVQRSREYLHYINERILWTRSADPLTVGAVRSDSESRDWLLSFSHWRGVAVALSEDPVSHPFAFWPTVVAIAAMFYVRLRIRPRLRALGAHATKRGFLRYGPTTQAAVLTLMSAVTAPATLLFISWRLAEAVDPNDFSRAVAGALETCAAVLFPVELLREACRHQGLAEAHFAWPARAVRHLRRALTWMKTLGLPVTFLAVLAHSHTPLDGGAPTERVLFIAGMALAALTVHRLFTSGSELSKSFLIEQPASLFSRFRPLWYVAAVVVPLGLAGLSTAGYHYSATQLAYRLLWTLWLAAGSVLVRAMAVRWVVLSRRRLLLDQAYQRRAAEEASASSEGDAPKPPAVEETDVAKSTVQTRKLIDVLMLGFAATGLAMIWADTLPAFGLLNRPVWTVTEAEAPAAADPVVSAGGGTEAAAASDASGTVRSVTTLDVALAAITAIFTLLASRNLPGLIEMSVLSRLPVDQATRYAATRLASYAIVIAGLMMASNRLGLRWQNIQWLVAALTVGLGFGLQEVFANFVSGLIILFERPVRVGDVVTIADVTGVVSKIRMRATTITNWDRKEFIVPNKEFITGKVLNWTLSDGVNRVSINVGVAHGTDPDRARELLVSVCREHPLVLKDPAPSATFEGFGDSALMFALRCFLPSLDLRSDVIHELHTRIDREFRRAGIHIALPQRDLQIRTVSGLSVAIPASKASSTSARPIERAAG